MKKYVVIVESGPRNFSAYLPDVDGCVTTGKTIDETLENMREALEMHFELMAEDGEEIPEPISVAGYVEIDVPETTKAKHA